VVVANPPDWKRRNAELLRPSTTPDGSGGQVDKARVVVGARPISVFDPRFELTSFILRHIMAETK
jgi:hypothetical protein